MAFKLKFITWEMAKLHNLYYPLLWMSVGGDFSYLWAGSKSVGFRIMADESTLLPSSSGTSVIKVTATDADDPTYGNSARLVYSILQGQPYFSVEPQTGIFARIDILLIFCKVARSQWRIQICFTCNVMFGFNSITAAWGLGMKRVVFSRFERTLLFRS